MQRYLEIYISQDLRKKMVFIGWPRQVGKTTLAKNIAKKNYITYSYLNWDYREDKQNILERRYQWWSECLIFDEIHKYPDWKNFLKGEFDVHKENYDILVTGSARLDIYQKWGDSLLGRYFYYRLHPLSLAELLEISFVYKEELVFSQDFYPEILEKLLHFGGFPEVFFWENSRDLRRWHNDRLTRLVREDIRDVSTIKDIARLDLMVSLLPNKVASQFSLNSLVGDLWVTHKTLDSWMQVLEDMYYCFRIYPHTSTHIKSLKKEPKLYLWDYSELKDIWAKSENIIAGHLLKYVHFLRDVEWYNAELRYLRDREQREVDFCIVIDDTIQFLVEVKYSSENISSHLQYFSKKLSIKQCYQVLVDPSKEIDIEKNGIRVMSASKFLTALV